MVVVQETGAVESKQSGSKAERTREQILHAALELFVEKGYEGTTLRDIAARAGVALGLAYRYFPAKESFVIALYERLVADLEEEVQAIQSGTLADRIMAMIRGDIRRCQPYRGAFAALAGLGLMPDSNVAVLGEQAAPVRIRVWNLFHSVVTGASDGMRGRQAEEFTTLIYSAHLLLMLFWLQDRSPGQKSTDELITLGQDALARFRFLLRIPQVSGMITRLVTILSPMFGPTHGLQSTIDSSGDRAVQ